jgi:hypothetical protein
MDIEENSPAPNIAEIFLGASAVECILSTTFSNIGAQNTPYAVPILK